MDETTRERVCLYGVCAAVVFAAMVVFTIAEGIEFTFLPEGIRNAFVGVTVTGEDLRNLALVVTAAIIAYFIGRNHTPAV